MLKSILLLQVLVAFAVASGGYQIIHPTYQPAPAPRVPLLRQARDVDDKPLWLYQGDNIPRAPTSGDHPYLPSIIDDVRLNSDRRYARSVDSPSARRGGGSESHSTGSGSRNTGPTHPGYNRRNSRDIKLPNLFDPGYPTPLPGPFDPFHPRPSRPHIVPIYARNRRDLDLSSLKKPPTVIPGWNPHAAQKPWQVIKHRF